jgi:hypothetical protein
MLHGQCRSCPTSRSWCISMLVGGLLTADAVACMLAVILHCIPVSFRHRLPRYATSLPRVDTCWGGTSGWLRGQGEVSRCFLLTHCMVRTRAAVGRRRCIPRTSAPQKSSSRAPHRWRQLVDTWNVWGSNASSEGARYTLSTSRGANQHARGEGRSTGAAGGVSGGCDGWSPNVCTLLPAFLERSQRS